MWKAKNPSHISTAPTTTATGYTRLQTKTGKLQQSLDEKNGAGQVTIKFDGHYYYVSGLDARAEHMSFVRHKDTLEGFWTADLDYLKEHYDGFPESVLVQANHKVEFHVVIKIEGDSLTAKSDNASISYDANGVYHGWERVPGYYYWLLTRPKK